MTQPTEQQNCGCRVLATNSTTGRPVIVVPCDEHAKPAATFTSAKDADERD